MRHTKTKARRPAFTLAEAAISTVIVGVMLTAALTAAGRAGRFGQVRYEQMRGQVLAEELLAEILSRSYWDPSATGPTAIGPGSDEQNGTRSLFDDVDDYHGWLESPPSKADGTALTSCNGWYRKVTVTFVSWSAPQSARGTDLGLKSIVVEVGRIRSGGQVSSPADRLPVTSVSALAGRGRGL